MARSAEAVEKSGYFGQTSTYVLPTLHAEIDRTYESGRLMPLDARAAVGVTQHARRSRSSIALARSKKKSRGSDSFAKELNRSFTSFERLREKHDTEVTSKHAAGVRLRSPNNDALIDGGDERRELPHEASDVTQVRKTLQRRKHFPLAKIRAALRIKAMNKKLAEARGAPAALMTSFEQLRQDDKSLQQRVSPMFALTVQRRHFNRRLSAVSERREISPSTSATPALGSPKRAAISGSAPVTPHHGSSDVRGSAMTPPAIHRKLVTSGVRRRQTMANLAEVKGGSVCSVRFQRFGEACFIFYHPENSE